MPHILNCAPTGWRRARRPSVRLRRCCRTTTAALEYAVNADAATLFVVTRKPPFLRQFALPVSAAALTAKVGSFPARIARRDLDFASDARELSRLLVEP